MKYLRVTMPDGSKWDVPAETIAKNRALHYSDGETDSEDYKEEFDYAMNGHAELKDWAANNMNWKDVVSVAMQVEPASLPDLQEGWMNGPKEIIER